MLSTRNITSGSCRSMLPVFAVTIGASAPATLLLASV
jgi:hypothetical protein